MKIVKTKVIHGPNIYHNRPILVTKVDLEELAEIASSDFPSFNEMLLEKLPGLVEHTCSPGYRGGFCERLRRGTYMAHIIEHVALELSELTGIGVSYGKTVYAGEPGHYEIVTRFLNEEGMKACHLAALELVHSIVRSEEFDLGARIGQIKEIIANTKMGPSTQAIYDAALARRIPCRRVGSNSLLRLGYGKNIRHVQAALTDRTSSIAVDLVQDKFVTKEVLREAGIPTPTGEVFSSVEELAGVLSRVGFPMAVKPLDGNHGNGVHLNINCEREAKDAFFGAKKFSSEILAEKMCFGRDYRALVIGGKLKAVAERVPPQVKGDGKSTIKELIDALNADPRRADGHLGLLTRIEIDECLENTLKKYFLSLHDIPLKGEKVLLRENANLSGGGTAHDVTEIVHPTIKAACERIARIVGLDICGIDLIHPDISRPAELGLQVIEVNAGPGLRMHLAPSKGMPRDVGRDIVEMLYKRAESARIPIFSVTGTNGKTSTVRMLAKIMALEGQCVGMTSSEGIWIGEDRIESGDTTGPLSAGKVLSDPKVECAVLEVARGGIMRGGLGYDYSDIGIVTNIRPDHIGQDGIEGIEDLVRVKSLIVERVREGGAVVLNADDEKSLSLAYHSAFTKTPRRLFLYSTKKDNPALSAYVESGGDACWVESGEVRARCSGTDLVIGAVNRWPVTFDGMAEFQISNALAAVSAALAANKDPQIINQALEQFSPGTENPGRLSLFHVRNSYVLVDYGHNPDAISAIGEMLRYQNYKKTVVVSLPGDRESDLLRESGHSLAKYFDRVILKDDACLRGRQAGEVPSLLREVLSAYPGISTETVLDEAAAVEKALMEAVETTLTVIFYDDLDTIQKVLNHHRATPVQRFPAGERLLSLVQGGVRNGQEDSVITAVSI